MQRSFRTFFLLCVATLLVVSLNAQDITKGSIAGVVKDATGAVVPGANITLASPYGTRSTTSDPRRGVPPRTA